MVQPQAKCGTTRCYPWKDSFASWCEAPQFVQLHPERYHAVREFAWAFSPRSNQSVIYWITPKSAHTTIINRLMSSFKIHKVAISEYSNDHKRRILNEALKTNPLEFTFIRDPLWHTVSGAQELQVCAKRVYGRHVDLLDILLNVSADSWQFARCKELHIFPQISGYSSLDDRGINRLHFIGRVERLRHDWSELLSLISEPSPKRIPIVNRRPRNEHDPRSAIISHPSFELIRNGIVDASSPMAKTAKTQIAKYPKKKKIYKQKKSCRCLRFMEYCLHLLTSRISDAPLLHVALKSMDTNAHGMSKFTPIIQSIFH